jgi:hypothetical protein
MGFRGERRVGAKLWVPGAGVALVLAVVHSMQPEDRDAVSLKPHPESTFVPSVINAFTPKEPVLETFSRARALAPALRVEPERLSAEVTRRSSTGRPADAYLAYRLSAHCEAHRTTRAAMLQEADRSRIEALLQQLPAEHEVCGDLSAAQIARRVEWLQKAALAGVHGAYASLVAIEGPSGLLGSMADGDAFRELRAQAFEAALETADPDALLEKSHSARSCGDDHSKPCRADPAQSLAYWVAFHEAKALDDGTQPPPDSELAAPYARDLPPDALSRAIADGRSLAASARRPR